MSNPASWYALLAIAGFSLDLHNGKLIIAPNLPRAIGGGKKARGLPIFHARILGQRELRAEGGGLPGRLSDKPLFPGRAFKAQEIRH
ncbi:MAG TPA: hypothetical protein EYP53_05255 [Candidatus Latescibacteria bacterium]|nr:hypothetical protein [Candidatus Latescibacterota bacterium]